MQERTRRATRINPNHGVESLEKIRLNGADQWILMRGQDRTRPVLLFLHGGPGMPLMPFRAVHASLEDYFVVVHWDQRGAGKSYHSWPSPKSMTSDQLFRDAAELVNHLRQRFRAEKICLAGHSWGSMLGILLAARHPEWFYGYFGISQPVNLIPSSEASWRFTFESARRAQNQPAMDELLQIGLPPWHYRQMLAERKWVTRLGGQVYRRDANRFFLKHLLSSPEYSMIDLGRLVRGLEFSAAHLWPEIQQMNIAPMVPRLKVPAWFLAGRQDFTVPQQWTAQFIDELEAPHGKELIWFDQSAHWPHLEEPEKFHQFMIQWGTGERRWKPVAHAGAGSWIR